MRGRLRANGAFRLRDSRGDPTRGGRVLYERRCRRRFWTARRSPRASRASWARGDARSAPAASQPGLAVVLVGEDPASQIYVRNKTAACAAGRLPHLRSPAAGHHLAGRAARAGGEAQRRSGRRRHPDPAAAAARARRARVLPAVDPRKDVDGIHPDNLGRLLMGEPRFVACTPFGIMKLDRGERPFAGGDERRGGRALEHGRQADGGAADRRRRDRDASATRRRAIWRRSWRAPIWWWPRWGARR